MAQVGEDRDVEMDALDPGLDERVTRDFHGDGVPPAIGELAIPDPGQQPLHFCRLRRRSCPRKGAHDVGRSPRRLEDVAEELGDGRLAVGPGHPDHEEIAGRETVEGRGQPGHDGADRPRRNKCLHDGPIQQFGDEVLTEQPDGSPVDRVGRKRMPVGDKTGHAAEEVTGHDPTTVVRNAADVDCGRVSRCLNDFDVVEEKVHLHGSHGRPNSGRSTGVPRLAPSAR